MLQRRTRRAAPAALLVVAVWASSWPLGRLSAQSDLDLFMRLVLSRRDENWKKLQQYVLDEREVVEVRGPSRAIVWGERRDFTWYQRDGRFVRSPVAVNGAPIGESDRLRYEAEFLRREDERDSRGTTRTAPSAPSAADVDALIQRTREPQFISTAYFLRFKFEAGRYALVGKETLDGRELLRVEYYPTELFRERARGAPGRPRTDRDTAYSAELRRLMNKVALVTLWIEPATHQIVKYTFDNVALDFLPAQWLLRVDDAKASMIMDQPFPDVWLPRNLEVTLTMTLAVGAFDLRYALSYHDYRRADVTSRVTIPDNR
jgi:hypothetical protein